MPTIRFENSDEPLDAWELAQFLSLFRATYSHALGIRASEEEIVQNPERYMEIFSQGLPKDESARFLAELFSTDHGPEELRINRIVKSSPLEIAFIGVLSALTLAVIFNGGKVELKNLKDLKFTLPPLGTGIKSMRAALRMPPAVKQKKGENRK
jgi:hypothetical protein